jgi:SAM-dependent methyltransferase
MTAMKRYRWDSAEYAEAFATLLRSYDSRKHLHSVIRDLLIPLPAEAAAIDWGAGTGDLTRILLERARTVFAVEPSPALRLTLAANCPAAQIIDGTIATAVPPRLVDVGLLSHVLYHVPDHLWGAYVLRAANYLAPTGVLLVVLKDPDSACNQMLEHFGAPPFDLPTGLMRVMRLHKEFDFSFSHSPHRLSTTSFEDTLRIARFMMADRDESAFSRQPSESQFQDYVRTHFWDEEKQTGGWSVGDVYCFIRRNPRWQ